MNDCGDATKGDLRARAVWHIEEARHACGVGPGCPKAGPTPPCCGDIVWVEISQSEQLMVLPGYAKKTGVA